jgi:hypothetical protein
VLFWFHCTRPSGAHPIHFEILIFPPWDLSLRDLGLQINLIW